MTMTLYIIFTVLMLFTTYSIIHYLHQLPHHFTISDNHALISILLPCVYITVV